MCAIIRQGILGAFSGKVANVVGTSWKGIAVMKSLPPSVANPKTAKQLAQRANLSAVVELAKPILGSVVKPLNDRFQSRQSGYNFFVQQNIKCFTDGVFTSPADFIISPRTNKAQLIDAIAAESILEGMKKMNLYITSPSIAGEGKALATDHGYVVCVNRTKMAVAGGLYFTRNLFDGNPVDLEVEFSSEFELGDVIDAYMAFLRADGTVAFATAYATTTIVSPD